MMAKSNFRHRGIEVVVDTTKHAEFDIAGFQLPKEFAESIAGKLRTITFSNKDRIVGAARIREIDGYDVVFVVGREKEVVVITVAAVLFPNRHEPTEEIMRQIGAAAILRSATGL